MVSLSDDGGSSTIVSLGFVSGIAVFRTVSSFRGPCFSCLSSAWNICNG